MATTNPSNTIPPSCTEYLLRALTKLDTLSADGELNSMRNQLREFHKDIDTLFDKGCLPLKEVKAFNKALPLRFDEANTRAIITFRNNNALINDLQQLHKAKPQIEDTLYKYLPTSYQVMRDFAKFLQT